MKILQIMAGGSHGGAESAFVDMCLALHEAGQEIQVVTRANPIRVPRLRQAGITVHTLPFGRKIDLYTPWAIRRIIKRFKPDILQSWMSRGTMHMPRWHENMGVKRYATCARLGGYYKLKYFQTADYFTTITPDIRTYLIDNGIQPDHVKHINNFAETEKTIIPIDRSSLDTPKDAPVVLGLGRLHTAKAFDTLIKAVHALPDVYLWIAGEGPERSNLERLITDLNCADRVKLLGWRNDRAALFQAADICFFSSRYEPFGTVFVQAWANKTPLITTDADGPRQFVQHEKDGLIVPIDNHASFTDAIQRIINDTN